MRTLLAHAGAHTAAAEHASCSAACWSGRARAWAATARRAPTWRGPSSAATAPSVCACILLPVLFVLLTGAGAGVELQDAYVWDNVVISDGCRISKVRPDRDLDFQPCAFPLIAFMLSPLPGADCIGCEAWGARGAEWRHGRGPRRARPRRHGGATRVAPGTRAPARRGGAPWPCLSCCAVQCCAVMVVMYHAMLWCCAMACPWRG